MKDRQFGVIVTVAIHLGVLGGAWVMNTVDRAHAEEVAKTAAADFTSIEAGLAVRSSAAKGKRSRLPQKDVVRAKAPETVGVATHLDTAVAKPDGPAANPESVFDKFRKVNTEEIGTGGDSDETRAGQADGSEYGTLEDMKGDPYVGELVGRMTTNPDLLVPSVVSEGGLESWGCVKLDARGEIVERAVPDDHKSKNRTFNRAVEERLKITTNMEQEVPAHLHDQLVEKWLCVPYRY